MDSLTLGAHESLTRGKDLFDLQHCPGQFPLVSLLPSVLITRPSSESQSSQLASVLCVCVCGLDLGGAGANASLGRCRKDQTGAREKSWSLTDWSSSPGSATHWYVPWSRL